TRLGFIIFFSLCCILALGYYISPKANVASVQVKGAPELNSRQVVKTVGISPENKVVFCLLKGKEYSKKLSATFPEIEKVQVRSEEHTSESSHVSISYAVFCLK